MEKKEVLLDVVRQNYASVVWTHKIQEKQAELYAKDYKILETVNIISAALTSCGIITCIFCDNLIAQIITALLSFVTLTITAYFKSFDLKSLETICKTAANQFIGIRNDLLMVITEVKYGEKTLDETKETYEEIICKLNKLYVDAPSTTHKAYKLAEQALRENREYTFSDEEIDIFLPQALRSNLEKNI